MEEVEQAGEAEEVEVQHQHGSIATRNVFLTPVVASTVTRRDPKVHMKPKVGASWACQRSTSPLRRAVNMFRKRFCV